MTLTLSERSKWHEVIYYTIVSKIKNKTQRLSHIWFRNTYTCVKPLLKRQGNKNIKFKILVTFATSRGLDRER